MTVLRTELAEDPSVMSIHYGPPAIAQKAVTSPSPSEPLPSFTNSSDAAPTRIEQINMKNFTSSEILEALLKLTNAQPVPQTPDDIELLERLEREAARSAEDAKLSLEVRTREKRDRELLEQARGDI
jgi:large subunit ribosomal protein MRP49